jgi:hypothetical protein
MHVAVETVADGDVMLDPRGGVVIVAMEVLYYSHARVCLSRIHGQDMVLTLASFMYLVLCCEYQSLFNWE